ncbi:helix-turn-helix domain-containing protein [Paenisporosarcina indica]|uniref:helix-turn-helix domain-containing protein n=1 Tax=Paenisporosarcina indica TaxID=650093 RepID=UPI00095035B3|nr:helix-turn-helix transcriptional regulator [Paenisporosarcina indica]
MENIGLRIRQLRKEQKLTLEALAGKKLTKGMLSLIENGKAQPSMESLSYIAQQLGVETTELMEEVSQSEKRSVLEEVEKLYKVEFSNLTDEHSKIVQLIEPLLDKLTISYESARLLEIYSRCAYNLNRDNWEISFAQAQSMYDQLHLYNQSASLTLFKGLIRFNRHEYQESLDFILHEHEEMKRKSIQLDAMTTLDYLYIESILYSAVGNYDLARFKMNEAISYSKEKKLFYRIDDLYRFACFQAIINGDEGDRRYYLHKVRQYGEFAEDKNSAAIAELLEAHYYNSYALDYKNALIYIERFHELVKELDKENPKNEDNNHYRLEKGKALLGLGFINEATELLEAYIVPVYLHHPYDLSMAYEVHSYRALCYSQLGDMDQALEEAQLGVDLITPMPDTPYKKFINQTLAQIQN